MPKKDEFAVTESPVTESGEPVFDFTVPVEAMPRQTQEAYYRLRFVALNRGNEVTPADMPDGKVMTLAEVESSLGAELGAPAPSKPCC